MPARNSEEARARAEERFERLTAQQKQAEQVHKEREKAAKATADRVEQLRAMRLAREAEQQDGDLTDAQREAAAEAEEKRAELLTFGQPPKPPVAKRRRTTQTKH